MACKRAAVSLGKFASVVRMKGRYGSMRLARSGEELGEDGTGAPSLIGWPASTRRTASRCTCNCRAMVPTRHFSTVCRRRIRATRSGAMVMAAPYRQAVTQEALAQCRGLQGAAAAAGPAGPGDGFLRGAVRQDALGGVDKLDACAVVCPCHQWSRRHPRLGTLVRHVMCVAPLAAVGGTDNRALAPATRAVCVRDAAAPRALVALRGLPSRLGPGLMPTQTAAIAVAAVAATAQDNLDAASRAQVQAGGLVHAHPGTTEVLDGLVPARHTAVAPPSSARCRARYGGQASRRERPMPRPPSSASTALYRGAPTAPSVQTDGATARHHNRCTAH